MRSTRAGRTSRPRSATRPSWRRPNWPAARPSARQAIVRPSMPEREPEVAPERKARPSLWEQVQADLANLEALEAKLNRDAAEARAQAEAEALEAAAELAAKAPADSGRPGQA